MSASRRSRLGPIIESSPSPRARRLELCCVVRDKREALMKNIAAQVNEEAKEFGLKIVDVRIKRADLPEANMQTIYHRMQAERQREAAEFRAEGAGAARRIRATADREVTVIKAEATRESERIRGDGRCRAQPHLRRSLRPGSGFLRLLPLDAGLRGGFKPERYPLAAVPRFRVLQVFQWGWR